MAGMKPMLRAVRMSPRNGEMEKVMGIEDVLSGSIQEEEPVVEEQPIAEEPIEIVEEPVVEESPVEEVVAEEPKTVPLATFLDQRDELKELRRWKQEQEAKANVPQPQQAPDPYDDPQGFAAYQSQTVQEAVTAQKFDMSDLIARQTHGDEAVEAATQWASERAAKNPAFAAEYMRERHPIDWIVRQHKRDSLISQVGDDPDEFVRRRAAELGLIAAPAPVVETQQVVTPARSLASAPSKNGGVKDVPLGPMTALNTLFK